MYENCRINHWFQKKDGRWHTTVIFPDGSKKTTSRARYNYEYFWDIELDSETQHVDHIDDNKLNDSVENLQILTPKENRDKYNKDILSPYTFNCPICGVEKTIKGSYYKFKVKKQKYFFCSITCASKGRKGRYAGLSDEYSPRCTFTVNLSNVEF